MRCLCRSPFRSIFVPHRRRPAPSCSEKGSMRMGTPRYSSIRVVPGSTHFRAGANGRAALVPFSNAIHRQRGEGRRLEFRQRDRSPGVTASTCLRARRHLPGSCSQPASHPATFASERFPVCRRAWRQPRGCGSLSDHGHTPDTIRKRQMPSARYHALLQGVIARKAELVARWLLVGFIPRRHEHRQYFDIRREPTNRLYGHAPSWILRSPSAVFSSDR